MFWATAWDVCTVAAERVVLGFRWYILQAEELPSLEGVLRGVREMGRFSFHELSSWIVWRFEWIFQQDGRSVDRLGNVSHFNEFRVMIHSYEVISVVNGEQVAANFNSGLVSDLVGDYSDSFWCRLQLFKTCDALGNYDSQLLVHFWPVNCLASAVLAFFDPLMPLMC